MKKRKAYSSLPLAGKIARMIMLCKDITTKQLAEELKVTHSYVSMLIYGKKKNEKYRKKILEKLQLPPTFWENPLQVDFNQLIKNSQDTNVTFSETINSNENKEGQDARK